MRCGDVQELLAAYLDGEVNEPAVYGEISNHLENCARCRVERDQLALALARISTIMRAAGKNIPVSETRWVDIEARTGQQATQPTDELQYNNHHHRGSVLLTKENQKQGGARQISLTAGAISFAVALALLIGGIVVVDRLNTRPKGSVSPSGATAMLPSTPTPIPTLEPTSTATFTPAPSPTADLAAGRGGFTTNVIDVSALPEYTFPAGGGGGGGGGGGCPEQLGADQTVSQYEISHDDWKGLCLYDIPDASNGAKFTVTLTSPSGRSFSEQYTISSDSVPPQVLPVDQGRESGFIESDGPRRPIDLSVHFWAAQEYGDWHVEAVTATGQLFASGTVTVSTRRPIYSVTHFDDPLDPFMLILDARFYAGDRVLFAGRGLEAKSGQSMILALYSPDPARTSNTTVTMIPYYATRIAVAGDGTFRAEFMIGSHTPPAYFTAVFDPAPGAFKPENFGMAVGQ